MSMSPQQIVKERHGEKSTLIDAVIGLVEPLQGEESDAHRRRLRNVSNAKLLHLLAIGERVKELGGRDAIVTKILELKGQPKDHEYADRLRKLSLGRIVDMVGSLQRAAKRDGAAPKAAAPKKAPKKATPKAPEKSASAAPKSKR